MRIASTILLAVVVSAALVLNTARLPAAESGFSSMVESFSSGVKSGFSKVSEKVLPKSKPSGSTTSDATSLLVKAKPSAKLFVAVARTYLSNGNSGDAEDMYRKALTIESDNAEALTGLALLKDQQGAYGEAVILYEQAARSHPEDPAVFNAMGLCHATHGNFKPALAALEHTVRLQPRELKYRNNIAMVLVEMGRYEDAFSHFRTQYDSPVAHYNLAYLLQKRGDEQNALKHFAAAVQENPGFDEARTWYEHLARGQSPQQGTQFPAQQNEQHQSQYSKSNSTQYSDPAHYAAGQHMNSPQYSNLAQYPTRQMTGPPAQVGTSMLPQTQAANLSAYDPRLVASRTVFPQAAAHGNMARGIDQRYGQTTVAPYTAATSPFSAPPSVSPPEMAQNAIQRTGPVNTQNLFPQRPSLAQRRVINIRQKAARDEAIAQSQFEALAQSKPTAQIESQTPVQDNKRSNADIAQSPKAPVSTTTKNETDAKATSSGPDIQRLPPVERSVASIATQSQKVSEPTALFPAEPAIERVVGRQFVSPGMFPSREINQQKRIAEWPEKQLSNPPAPLPPTTASTRPSHSESSLSSPAVTPVAPMPGSTTPEAPPATGTTRAPMVYPLPPVDEYSY